MEKTIREEISQAIKKKIGEDPGDLFKIEYLNKKNRIAEVWIIWDEYDREFTMINY